MRKIVTHNICPPIPMRQYDWCAHFDGQEEAGQYGYGATEAAAIADFVENYAEDHDERLGGLRAADCTTTKDWEQWARERREYEEPYGAIGGRY